VQAHSICI